MTDTFIQVPPDSTGKKLHGRQHTVGSDEVVIPGQHVISAHNPSNGWNIDGQGAAYMRFADGRPSLDAFGNLMAAPPVAVAAYAHDKSPESHRWWDDAAAGGAITHEIGRAAVRMAVDGSAGARANRTTNRYHYYSPGAGLTAQMTVYAGDAGRAGNVRRWGYGDASDGLFFELSETGLAVVLRSSVSGSVVETRVPQASWNGHAVDGTGDGGFNLDLTMLNIYWIDFQWLGAGAVRFGVVSPGGGRLVVHTIENANSSAGPYMRTGSLPLRFENENTGAPGAGSELYLVCAGLRNSGDLGYAFQFWGDMDFPSFTNTGFDWQPFVSLRPKLTVNGQTNRYGAYPTSIEYEALNAPLRLRIYRDAALTGATWAGTSGGSMEFDATATAAAGGDLMMQLFLDSNHSGRIDLTTCFPVENDPICVGADGVSQPTFTFMLQGAWDAGDLRMSLLYREL